MFASEEEFVLEADALEEVFSLNNVTVDELKNINRSTSLLKSDLINILFNERPLSQKPLRDYYQIL